MPRAQIRDFAWNWFGFPWKPSGVVLWGTFGFPPFNVVAERNSRGSGSLAQLARSLTQLARSLTQLARSLTQLAR